MASSNHFVRFLETKELKVQDLDSPAKISNNFLKIIKLASTAFPA